MNGSIDWIGKAKGYIMGALPLVLIWGFGIIINNAHLDNYGLFDWQILDAENVSSGLLFSILASLVFLLGWSYQYERDQRRTILVGSVAGWYLLWSFLLMVLCIVTYVATPRGLAGHFAEYASLLLMIFSLFLLGRISSRVKAVVAEIRSRNTGQREESDSNGYNILSHILAAPWRSLFMVLIFINLFLSAWIFGKYFYEYFPKVFMGGKPIYVRYEFTGNQYLDSGRIYKLLDRTNDKHFLYDDEKGEAIVVKRPFLDKVIEIYSQDDIPLRLAFASDLHITDKVYHKHRPGRGFDALDSLAGRWNNVQYTATFLLGDILEGPDDAREWRSICDSTRKMLGEIEPQPLVVIGNNDCRNSEQLSSFRSAFSGCYPGTENFPNWDTLLNDDVAVIGLYVPDKMEQNITAEYVFPDSLRRMYEFTEQNLKKYADSLHVRMILILTHQGLTEDNVWSFGYRIEDKMDSVDINGRRYAQPWMSKAQGRRRLRESRYCGDFRSYT
jgi:hypothetical protein